MLSFGMPTLVELPTAEQSVQLCSSLGLDFVELNMSFPQYQPEEFDIPRYLRLKEEYGVYFTVHIDEAFDPCSVNRRIARVYTETFLQAVELAKLLGIPCLNMHMLRGVYVTLPERRTYVYAENEAGYLAALREFRDRAAEAAEGCVAINVENTDGFDLPFLLHGLDTLLENSSFGLTYDIGHDNAIGGADSPVILSRESRLRHMHMHDAVGTRVHLALGDGELEIIKYLELAKKHGCRVVLETKTVAALKKSVDYLKGML